MNSYIQYSPTKLINFLLLTFLFISCNSNAMFQEYHKVTIQTPTGENLKVYLAISRDQQTQGLSTVKKDEFSDNEAMLFYGKIDLERHFWMPNTYFDLDIIFLNEDFYVLDIHRSLKHFPYSGPESSIPRSKRVKCRHVLEIKSSSPVAKKIQPGMILKWTEKKTLEQIVSSTHQLQ